ncbi:MAG TPA: putative ABC exporter domain-containing protein [Tepidisphaeraceae bacterium]|jgi:hypothetical protein
MNALVLLYGFQAKALGRRVTRNLRSVKGALLFIFGVAVIGLWMAPSIWQAMRMRRTDPAAVLDAAPVLLLASCILQIFSSGGEKAIAFTPGEVDFLFPGPFTRRQLLAYKLGKALAAMTFSATLLCVVLLRHAAGWSQAWVALLLGMMFLQLFGMVVTLVGQTIGERAYTRGRKLVLGLVLLALLVAALPLLKSSQGRPGFFQIAHTVRTSRVGGILLAPLDVFGRLFTASSWWPTGLMYLGLALLVDLALMFVVFYLDADYLETSAAKSAALYERLQRVRRGGIMGMARPAKPGAKVRGAVPLLPAWRGAGPIAWRQATAAVRSSRGMLMILLLLAIGVGPVILGAGKDKAGNVAGIVVGAMAWITLIVSGWLRFDFRGDLDNLDYLKSLPITPWAVAAGQLITPTALMTACHLLIVGTVLAAVRHLDVILLFAVVVCLPFNAMMFAIENLVFLLFPTRAAANPADFQGYGRQILLLFAKGVLILIAGALAAGFALVVHVTTSSWPAAAITAGIVLSAVAVALVPLVGWAYARFDVTGDMPA